MVRGTKSSGLLKHYWKHNETEKIIFTRIFLSIISGWQAARECKPPRAWPSKHSWLLNSLLCSGSVTSSLVFYPVVDVAVLFSELSPSCKHI